MHCYVFDNIQKDMKILEFLQGEEVLQEKHKVFQKILHPKKYGRGNKVMLNPFDKMQGQMENFI